MPDRNAVFAIAAAAALACWVGSSSSITDGLPLAAMVIFWSLMLDAVAYLGPRIAHIIKTRGY